MTEAAIISGSLVDVRNVGTHKSVKLTIHVPEEYAMKVVAAFGWPTGVNPISVAIARLNPESEVMRTAEVEGKEIFDSKHKPETRPRPVSRSSAGAYKPKSPAQVAGYLCTVQAFQRFLDEKYSSDWDACVELFSDGAPNEKVAIEVVRLRCRVKSRADITDDNPGWRGLIGDYRAWEKEAEVVG